MSGDRQWRARARAWPGGSPSSPGMETVFVAPGNGGTALEPRLRNLPADRHRSAGDVRASARRSTSPSSDRKARWPTGIVDAFRARGLPIFGPTRAAARLESSKDFAKEFMMRHPIPTASYRTFTDPVDRQGLHQRPRRADRRQGRRTGCGQGGGGRGHHRRSACRDRPDDGRKPVRRRRHRRVLVEEWLEGEEASFIVMVDGRNVLTLAIQPGPQAAARRRPGPEHRRDGRLLAGADRHAGDPPPACCARSSCPPSRDECRGPPVHRLSLCRTDDRPSWRPEA